MTLLFLFIFGLFIGSFLNVLIDRIPRDESFTKGRSYCESCKKNLHFFDLIPVASFIFLKGKCRYCRTSLSLYYPLVEIVTGVMFMLAVFNLSFNIYGLKFISVINLLFLLFIISSLIIIFFTDLKYGIIPDKILIPLIIVSFAFVIQDILWIPHHLSAGGRDDILLNVVSGLAAFFFFLFLYLTTKGRGMGFGDVKLAFFMGLFLGFPKIIFALYVAFLTGALVSIILVLRGKKRFRGGTVPFGPFLVLGTVAGFVWGEQFLKLFGFK